MKNVHSIDIRSENYKKRVAANKEMAKETKDNEDSWMCELEFVEILKTMHVRLYIGDFPYECPVDGCDEKFSAWNNLKFVKSNDEVMK